MIEWKKITEYKNILCALTSLFLITSNVYASEVVRPMDGFYLGGDIGYSKHKIEGFAEAYSPTSNTFPRTNINIEDNNSLLRANMGFGNYWSNNMFTGVELGYQKKLRV